MIFILVYYWAVFWGNIWVFNSMILQNLCAVLSFQDRTYYIHATISSDLMSKIVNRSLMNSFILNRASKISSWLVWNSICSCITYQKWTITYIHTIHYEVKWYFIITYKTFKLYSGWIKSNISSKFWPIILI